MKMTNMEMEQNIIVLHSLNESGKLGYAIARNIRKLKDAVKEYLDLKDKLLAKYGTPNEDGRTVKVPNDKLQEYIEEMGDIPQIEHDVDIFQIPDDVFWSGNLTSNQMSQLLWMVEE